MKLVEVTPEAANHVRARHSKWRSIVREFLDSGLSIAEVTEYGTTITAAYHGLLYAVKNSACPVKVMRRKEHIYLVREGQ